MLCLLGNKQENELQVELESEKVLQLILGLPRSTYTISLSVYLSKVLLNFDFIKRKTQINL